MFFLVFLGALLLGLAWAPFVGYRLAGRSRYRWALRCGLCAGSAEFWVLECFDNQVLHLGRMYFDNGLQYIAQFASGQVRWFDVLNGRRPDVLLLGLLPLLAAFVGFQVDLRRRRAARPQGQ
jgi:hypothetical protein